MTEPTIEAIQAQVREHRARLEQMRAHRGADESRQRAVAVGERLLETAHQALEEVSRRDAGGNP